jgi:hypothetical protein
MLVDERLAVGNVLVISSSISDAAEYAFMQA